CQATIDRLEHQVQPAVVLDVLLVREVDRRAMPVHVGTGAERGTVAGQDDGAGIADVRECVGELLDEGDVEGVSTPRARGRDAEDVPGALDAEGAHSRLSFSISALTSRRTSASSWPKSSR